MQITYREILNQAYHDRNSANPSYSIRSFARDLGIPSSTLSEVLNGKKGISPKRSLEFSKKLKLPDWQIQLFCDLVTKEHAKSPRLREEAKQRLKNRNQENSLHLLNQTTLRSLTSWIDLAILELTYLNDFKPKASWIARKIGIDEAQAKNSIERLKSSQLIQINNDDGTWIDASPLLSSSDGISSESIRRFHRTVLLLALKKLENPDVDSRTVKSVVFSVSKQNVPRAKKILDDAISKIVSLADEGSQDRQDVMCYSSQLFSLLETTKDSM